MKKIILIGRSECGKTTLTQALRGETVTYHKTQYVNRFDVIIDTPGEYLQRRYFRGALMVTSVEADIILFVQDATEDTTWFPPSYNTQFGKPALGIVTKADIATPEQIETAKHFLTVAGASKLFVTSSVSGEGVDELLKYLGYL